jgi:hypothetical protein
VLNSSTGLVTLQGSVTCSRPLSGGVSGQLIQKRGNTEVAAFFASEVLCNGTARWTAITTRPRPVRGGSSPRPAVFGRATAIASAQVWMWDESTGEISEGEVLSKLRVR